MVKIDKENNYFEVLEQESSMPSPILVKRKYKEIMNRYALDEGVDPIDQDETKTKA